MSRAAGQVRVRATLTGAAVGLLVIAAIVALSDWLVPDGTLTLPLEAPAEEEAVPGAVTCPSSIDRTEPLELSSAELFDCPRLYDRAEVRYTGEVVGAVLHRGDRAWVQLNDDVYALATGPLAAHRTALGGNAGIAVSIPIDVAESVTHVGGPSASGDLVEVVGRFLRADPSDGGGPTIQADVARVSRRGQPLRGDVLPRRLLTAAALVLVTVLLAVSTVRARRRPW